MNTLRVGRLFRTRAAASILLPAVFGCALALALAGAAAENGSQIPPPRLVYTFSTIIPRAQWALSADGDRGASRIDESRALLDFSRSPRSLSITFPDRTMPGLVDKIRIKSRGNAKGLTVRLITHTHFMTFEKQLGPFTAGQELFTESPPGPGWEWHGGENDGGVHGPMRIDELRFEAAEGKATGSVEVSDLELDCRCPPGRQVITSARVEETGGVAGFACDLRAFSSEPIQGVLQWTVRTWDGEVLAKDSKLVKLDPELALLSVLVPGPTRPAGCRFAEAEFEFDAPGQDSGPVQAYWLAQPPSRENAPLQPESAFGMGIYLNRFEGDTMESVARKARDAGVKWSREEFNWAKLEPRKGEYRWDYFDHLVDCAHRNGISIYAIACYWSDWTKPYTKEGIDDYLHYLRALVTRYKDRIHQWEIWNEPNIFFWQGPREMYAELLTKSYRAIKEIDPQAQVLGLSTSSVDFRFIKLMLDHQAPFDILTVHPYRRVLEESGFIGDLRRASDLVKPPDGPRRPVWITEMGWATHVEHNTFRQDFVPVTPRVQAQLIARTYLSALLSGVEPRTFWYNFRNDGEDPFYFEHNLGIMQADGRPKPAYLAYATMTRLFNELKFERARDDWPLVVAGQFVPRGGTGPGILALWTTVADHVVEIPVAGGGASLVNAVGEERPIEVVEGKARILLHRNAPVYLVLPK